MNCAEPGQDLAGDLPGFRRWQRTAPDDGVLEVFAIDQLHHEVEPAILLPHVVHIHDIAVGDRGRGSRLALEALDIGLVLLAIAPQDLDRHLAIEATIAGAPGDRRRPRPDCLDQLVPIGEEPRLPGNAGTISTQVFRGQRSCLTQR